MSAPTTTALSALQLSALHEVRTWIRTVTLNGFNSEAVIEAVMDALTATGEALRSFVRQSRQHLDPRDIAGIRHLLATQQLSWEEVRHYLIHGHLPAAVA